MIDDLFEEISTSKGDRYGSAHKRTVFPEPAMGKRISERKGYREVIRLRRPLIHKRPPVDFHFLKISPSVNHVEVP